MTTSFSKHFSIRCIKLIRYEQKHYTVIDKHILQNHFNETKILTSNLKCFISIR